ncbi:hypothetical protein [Dyella sp.]|uniref:hypothetical protein n=1 Tax=Dyella sp. TaxID=1869338 RepID=UPI002FD9B245
MRRSPVIVIDRWVARTAFHIEGCAALPELVMELHRAGSKEPPDIFAPLTVDDDNRAVFAWGDRLCRREPGLYVARFSACGQACGEVTLQLGDRCRVGAAENIDYAPICDGPADPGGSSTVCLVPPSCTPAPVIYVPPYDVPRGC